MITTAAILITLAAIDQAVPSLTWNAVDTILLISVKKNEGAKALAPPRVTVSVVEARGTTILESIDSMIFPVFTVTNTGTIENRKRVAKGAVPVAGIRTRKFPSIAETTKMTMTPMHPLIPV